MTTAEARKLGWTIERGSYLDTVDDRCDRWYAYKRVTFGAVDHRGPGYRTRREALAEVALIEAAK